jgi:tRNA A37 threonylcarbamoyladenosine biosynthesis protein TsaE
VFLRGNLGAGKTEFAKGFVHGALSKHIFDAEKQWRLVELAQQGVSSVSDDEEFEENDDEVLSPTFSLINTYSGGMAGISINHLDLYRIKNAAELAALKLDKIFRDEICLVEWPERLTREYLPDTWIDVHIQHVIEENEEFRLISISQKFKEIV